MRKGFGWAAGLGHGEKVHGEFVSRADQIRVGIFAALCFVAQIGPALFVRGGSPYLSDQADQIQSGRLLLSGDWRHLYGPYMSDTVPLVRTIGPAGTLLFALPSFFGGFPAVEIVFIFFMALAPLLFYFEFQKTNPTLAAVWTALIIFVPHHWLFLTVAWESLLLLPGSLFVLTSFLRFLRRRSLGSLLLVFASSALALHFHLIAVLLAPFSAAALFLYWKAGADADVPPQERRRTLITALVVLTAAVLPYLIAEWISGSRNYKAVRANLGRWNDWQTGWQTALTVMDRVTTIFDAPGLFQHGDRPYPAPFWLSWPVLFAGSVWVLIRPLFLILQKDTGNVESGRQRRVELILWAVFALCHAAALLYFTKMSRPYLGDHYAAFLYPLTLFPMSTLLYAVWTGAASKLIFRRSGVLPNVLAWTIFGLWMIYSFTRLERAGSKSDWNFRAVTTALESACANPEHTLSSFELEGFYSPLAGAKPLLRYTLESTVTGCSWDEHSRWLVHPRLNGNPPVRLSIDVAFPGNPRGTFRLVRILPPGIGLYEREGGRGF